MGLLIVQDEARAAVRGTGQRKERQREEGTYWLRRQSYNDDSHSHKKSSYFNSSAHATLPTGCLRRAQPPANAKKTRWRKKHWPLKYLEHFSHFLFFFLREPCVWKSKLTNLPIMVLKSMHVLDGQAGNALWVTAKEVVHHMFNQNYPFFL